MKEQFSSFYRPSPDALKQLWTTANFVFDANVLLGLYRYPERVADELISSIEHVKNRVWLPHHAALEFYRNRLQVIAGQRGKVGDTKRIIGEGFENLFRKISALDLDRRHSYIEPNILMNVLREAQTNVLKLIDEHSTDQIDIHDDDKILMRLEKLFEGRVGEPFRDQAELDKIFAEGKQRFARNQPPGFKDKGKQTDTADFVHDGLSYEQKYGDFLVWKQLILHARESQTGVVFVTDDQKEDWWWQVNSQGSKTLGPRRELIEEFRTATNGKDVWLYTSDAFLKFSREFFKTKVSRNAISTISDIRRFNSSELTDSDYSALSSGERAERAVIDHLSIRYPNSQISKNRTFPDFTIVDEQTESQIAVEVITSTRDGYPYIHRMSKRLSILRDALDYDKCFLYIVLEKDLYIDFDYLTELSSRYNILIFFGFVSSSGEYIETKSFGDLELDDSDEINELLG